MRQRLRIILAVALLTVGVGALAGCIYVPTFGTTVERTNLSRQVGDADSGRPVRKGRATAADVARVLGRPEYVSPDGRRVVYTWRQLNGLWVGLCNGPDDTRASLTLDFDDAGVLENYNLARVRQTPIFDFWDTPRRYDLPGGLADPDAAARWRPELVGKAQAATRPATVPATSPSEPTD